MTKPLGETIHSSYAFCRQFSRRSRSNFYLGFLLLPPEKRRAMDALYAFMRHTDDLVDAAPRDSGQDSDKATGQRREQLRLWRMLLENALAGNERYCINPGRITVEQNRNAEATGKLLLPALVDTVQKYVIPAECLYAVLDGVEMDLDRHSYETFEELRQYCQRVASAVGLACIHIWGFSGQGTPEGDVVLEYARHAGIALQLTNVLRDLKADAAAGRIYLPQEDIFNCSYSVEELTKGVVNESFHNLMAMEIDRARQFYREGYQLINWIHPDGRRIFGLMMSTYRGILMKIAQCPGDVFSKHIGLSRSKRLCLAAGWALMPSVMLKKLDAQIAER